MSTIENYWVTYGQVQNAGCTLDISYTYGLHTGSIWKLGVLQVRILQVGIGLEFAIIMYMFPKLMFGSIFIGYCLVI
jgi:hypothetical protein